jgi:hypothetical protein
MKQILFFTILICSNPCLSQIERSLYIGIQKGIYVYNNQKDTLYLSEINVSLSCEFKDLQVVDSIQEDGIGSKEIIFFRSCGGRDDKVGSMSITRDYVNVSKYEIWNLDTKEKMFEATNFYRSKFHKKNAGGGRIKGKVSSSYNFRIDDEGTITISNLKIKTKGYKLELNIEKTKAKNKTVLEKSPYNCNFSADKTEGTYRYINGKYLQE